MVKSNLLEKVIHETQVKIDLEVLRDLVILLKERSDNLGGKPQFKGDGSSEQRSAFHSYNTVNKFLSRIDKGQPCDILDITGKVTDSCQRIYYSPSLTSYTKEFRKCIVPLNRNNVFAYFDLSAAEFLLNCLFCGEYEAVVRYQSGEDIYMYYAPLFPAGATRDVIKTCLIANMYGATDYSVAKRCNISQLDARHLLRTIDYSLPKMRDHKRYVIKTAKELGYYACPNGLDQSDLVKASSYKGEFNKDLALSAYVQSALGVWMQGIINRLKKRDGTLLSVFDSILFEVNPKSKDIVKNWCTKEVYPFRVSEVRFGNNFYEVCK